MINTWKKNKVKRYKKKLFISLSIVGGLILIALITVIVLLACKVI
jgi:hypothetical protein